MSSSHLSTDGRTSAPSPSPRRLVVALLTCALLVLAAVAGGVADAPSTVAVPLTTLAVAFLGWLVVPRSQEPLHTAVLAVGGLLVVLVVLGVVLDALPTGLTRTSWSVGAGAVALLALVVHGRRGSPLPARPVLPRPRREWLWGFVTTVLVLTAAVVAVRAAQRSETAPAALELRETTEGASVVLSAGQRSGPYDLFLVRAGKPSTLVTDVVIPAGEQVVVALPGSLRGRVVVNLVSSSSRGEVLRQVILDRS